ncbi:MAG TPA: hypothetical protein VFR81_04765 [Longimicrobium sp.]|nr:hypothetical protein [Longimicrobium sp.]
MRRHRALLAALLLAAAPAACGTPTTVPTDEDLVGTWTIQPADVPLPGGGGMQQMTVHFGGSGDYTLETATYGGFGSGELMAYEKTVGSVTVEDGGLRFHPTGSVGWDRRRDPHLGFPAFDAQALQQRPVPYTVSGDNLVLRLAPPGHGDSMVLTRQENE